MAATGRPAPAARRARGLALAFCAAAAGLAWTAPSFLGPAGAPAAGLAGRLAGAGPWPEARDLERVARGARVRPTYKTKWAQTDPHSLQHGYGGLKRKYMDKMVTSNFNTGEIMKRIVIVLARFSAIKSNDYPMRTLDIAKRCWLTGEQLMNKKYIMEAIDLLVHQKVITRAMMSPHRYELSEEYRAQHNVMDWVSEEWQWAPFKYISKVPSFERVKKFAYPQHIIFGHGEYRPMSEYGQKEWTPEQLRGVPIANVP